MNNELKQDILAFAKQTHYAYEGTSDANKYYVEREYWRTKAIQLSEKQ